MLHAYNIVSME